MNQPSGAEILQEHIDLVDEGYRDCKKKKRLKLYTKTKLRVSFVVVPTSLLPYHFHYFDIYCITSAISTILDSLHDWLPVY
jgi:hypothetical protein